MYIKHFFALFLQIWIPLVCVLGVLGFFVLIFWLASKFLLKKNKILLQHFSILAQKHGLQAFAPRTKYDYPYILGAKDRLGCAVDHENFTIRTPRGRRSIVFTFIRFETKQAPAFKLIMSLKKIYPSYDWNIGMTKIQVRDQRVADCFTLKANDEKLAQAILNNTIHKLLLEYLAYNWPGTIKLEKGHITYYERGVFYDKEKIKSFEEKFIFMNRLSQALSQS